MSSLPEAKLDVLLAHHASLEAESLGQLASERYVQITRELAELTPLIEAVKAYRSAVKELADTEALILDLDAKKAEAVIMPLLDAPSGSVSIRKKLTEFAEAEGLSL